MLNNKKILLIEDNDAHAKLIKIAFKNVCSDFNVIHIKDGEEALNWLSAHAKGSLEDLPKFILLDLNIPSVNGLDVLRELKSNDILKYIPIIILTTSTSNTDIKECYSLSANSYLVKPLAYGDFVDLVETLKEYWINKNTVVNIDYII